MIIPRPEVSGEYLDWCFARTLEDFARRTDPGEARERLAVHWLASWTGGSWWSRAWFWWRMMRAAARVRRGR